MLEFLSLESLFLILFIQFLAISACIWYTIIANKRAMKDYLIEYKKSLELDKELKKEQKLLREAINLLQYGFELEDEMFEKENTEEILKSQNNAPNRDLNIVIGDE